MASPSAFIQISSNQWSSLSSNFRNASRAFSAATAARIDFSLAQAMDANPAFVSYLNAQLQLNASSGSINVDSINLNTTVAPGSTQNATYASGSQVFIGASDFQAYLKNTEWLNNSDGFLFLDRNLNGQIDSSRELFSNGMLDIAARGLAGMRWVDSNYDGSLNAADPVWNELKVWTDADGDGQADAGETKTLSALGISSLNYAMVTFEQMGLLRQLASPDLQADTYGIRTHVVPEGIVVETSTGDISLLTTHIDDESLLEANRDGVSSYEDIETIISTADLRANDTLAGWLGQDLTVTGVSNFTHGTGYLTEEHFLARNEFQWEVAA